MHRLRALSLLVAVAACLAATAGAGSDAPAPSGVRPVPARVVNGVVTQDRPTVGALLVTSGVNHSLTCTGTLVGCHTFVTAAHCVCDGSPYSNCGAPAPSGYSVYLQDVGIVPVAAIHVDPSFSFGNRGDVAVITLGSDVTGVSPTPINTLARPPFDTPVGIAGFGLSKGGADDTGMLREGIAETSACTAANPDYHVCWSFTAPLGLPGLDSNTCNGDSGGPLFADLGAGESLVGITSGGTSTNCLPTDASYDTDVYVHRAFLQGIGGSDLANATCGSISQVGEVATTRATFAFDRYTTAAQACRKEFARQYASHAVASLKAWQACLDGVQDGSRSGPCPDATAVAELAAADRKVSLEKLAARCPDDVVPSVGAAAACSGATSAGDLSTCILTADAAAVAAALDVEYADADPTTTIAAPGARDCQQAIAGASAGLLNSLLKAGTRCQVALAAGKSGECPDPKTTSVSTKAAEKASGRIKSMCSDAEVALLDGAGAFGGACTGADTAAALAACQVTGHQSIGSSLLALLADQVMQQDVSFQVPAGTALLRVTLNGRDSGVNDLDLYVAAGGPASKASYTAKSENGGMFESVEIASPPPGPWFVHLERYAGAVLIPYQLTATAFQP